MNGCANSFKGLCYQPFCRSLTSLCEDAMFPRKKRKRRGEKDNMMVNGLRYIYKKSKRERRKIRMTQDTMQKRKVGVSCEEFSMLITTRHKAWPG